MIARLAGPYHFLHRPELPLPRRPAASVAPSGAGNRRGDAVRGRRDPRPRSTTSSRSMAPCRAGPGTGSSTAAQAVALLERAGAALADRSGALGRRAEPHGSSGSSTRPWRPRPGRWSGGPKSATPRSLSSAAWASGLVYTCRGELETGDPQLRGGARPVAGPAQHGGGARLARSSRGSNAATSARRSRGWRKPCGSTPSSAFDRLSPGSPCSWPRPTGARAGSRRPSSWPARGSSSPGRAARSQGVGWAERTLGHIAQARGALGDAEEHIGEALRTFDGGRGGVRSRADAVRSGRARAGPGPPRRGRHPSRRGPPAVPGTRPPQLGGAGRGAGPDLGRHPLTGVSLDIEAADARRRGRVPPAALVALLRDAVDSGASIGFLPPLAETEAGAYWRHGRRRDRARDRGSILAAHDGELGLVGSAQLDLAMRANAGHRAEVSKVMVHRRARRRGVGRALMLALEDHARRLGRTTLVLDTRQGDPSEELYRVRSAGPSPARSPATPGARPAPSTRPRSTTSLSTAEPPAPRVLRVRKSSLHPTDRPPGR